MTEDRTTQRTITVVMILIAALAFVFSFGNVWALALRLGVPAPIAPLIAPMVDLSVIGLLVALRSLSLRGVPAGDLRSATRLMHLSGLLTLALNTAHPLLAGHYGRAALDSVAPLLLLGWGSVGPALLRHFHAIAPTAPGPSPVPVSEPVTAPAPEPDTEPATAVMEPIAEPAATLAAPAPITTATPAPVVKTAPAQSLVVPEPLMAAARTIAASHLAAHGEPITPVQLRTRLGIALPLATAAHAALSV
ncbi:DUF2637 domain-containing protein [Streptomyces zaomyceticus]|uniref:DUF2637 domain-containing protein n=1 Tax=Streptomyces zaomyceticus TaxID=68286 RepID=UPI0016798754|nr:DUF2637 domain-containing protein [Streptomyces zaomyceticus]GHG24818.1 hypothetical protein GCM10018791_45610 [Streptomyces zaomyceticus]